MRSRYDFMQPGSVSDPITGSYYPDPLTLNYTALELTRVPPSIKVTDKDIINFPVTVYREYIDSRLDDMILSLNGCPHQNFLTAGDELYFPAIKDIDKSFELKR